MTFLKSPFNKVVRSHEAGFVGLLLGIIIGVLLMLFVDVHVEKEVLKGAADICGSIDNIKSANFEYTGKLAQLECKDSRVITDF